MKKKYFEPQIEETILTLQTGVMVTSGTPPSGEDTQPQGPPVGSPARIYM